MEFVCVSLLEKRREWILRGPEHPGVGSHVLIRGKWAAQSHLRQIPHQRPLAAGWAGGILTPLPRVAFLFFECSPCGLYVQSEVCSTTLA